MSVGAAIRDARLSQGLTQGSLAKSLYVSDSLLSAWEHGTRVPKHMARKVIKQLPRPSVILNLAHQVLGNAFVSPILNKVDSHWASLTSKADEELKEILERSPTVRGILFKQDLAPEERKAVWEWTQDLLDGRTVIDNTVSAICDRCGFNAEELFTEHWRKMEARGYYDPKVG